MDRISRKKLSLALAVNIILTLLLPALAVAGDLSIKTIREKAFIVPLGTDLAGAMAKFPGTIKCTLSDGSVKYLPVNWGADSAPAFNGNVCGNYVFEGCVTTKPGISNTGNLTARVTIKVSYLAITSIPTIDKTVDFGTSLAASKAGQGSTIKVNLNNRTQEIFPVLWCADTTPPFNPGWPGSYTLLGQVLCPANTRNPLHLRPTVNITVLPPVSSEKTTLVSADQIIVRFDRNIDASYLTAAGIQVRGFARTPGGFYSPATLSGPTQISYSVGGNAITINTADPNLFKFQTGSTDGQAQDIVIFAPYTIKDATEPALINTTPIVVKTDDPLHVVDRAAPVLIKVEARPGGATLEATYTECAQFAGAGGQTQYAVTGVAIPGAPINAVFAGNVCTLTFAGGTFVRGSDYSAATLSYVPNPACRVIDFAATPDAALLTIWTGILNNV